MRTHDVHELRACANSWFCTYAADKGTYSILWMVLCGSIALGVYTFIHSMGEDARVYMYIYIQYAHVYIYICVYIYIHMQM